MTESWLGVDLGGTNLRVGLVQKHTLQAVKNRTVPKTNESRQVYKTLVELIREVITDDVKGIGVAVPGAVDHQRGIVYNLQNIPSWHEVPLKMLLEKEFDRPAEINNDANAFVIGEKYFGQARDYNNVVGLILGTGLGSGILMNGHLYTGSNGGAGEFGMLPYREGILEEYCSGKFFHRKADISGQEAAQLFRKGDSSARQLFEEFGRHLGNALKMIVYAIDPHLIILGGSVSKSYPLFKGSMFNVLNSLVFPRTLTRLQITCSTEEHIAILGAAALCIHQHSLEK
ncbi:MAG: ROK family protein [Lentisphaeria bacterium]|nr:ROK family protein [Candidatus Neomarinimicrobiota bacterium]MCF7842363.1 ROK family protein [Lentisphaeria bacterium]